MVSVIVPFHNGGPYLGELLTCLSTQSVTGPWEVVAVDNDSRDHSRAVAERFRDRLPLRVASATARRNPSYARNEGARIASGDKLLFIDADDQVAAGYVEAMTRSLDDHPLVTSRVDSVTLNAPWVRDAHGPPWQADDVATFFGFLPATGVNIGVRRALFQSVGGFPEEFSGSEDVAFSWNAQLAGARIQLVTEAVYLYRYRDSLRSLYRQAANWGRDNALLYARFRTHGMPGRRTRDAVADWMIAGRGLLTTRGRAARAPAVVRAGFCIGRLHGSLRYGVWYP